MTKIEIKQIRSTIRRTKRQKDTIVALGLGKINKTVVKEATPQILGMVRKVDHLVSVKKDIKK